MNRYGGFTLIELLIAVTIVSILAAIAIPSYQSYLFKSRRSDAIVELSRLQLAEEKYRAGHTSYTDIPLALGVGSNTTPGGSYISGGGYYNIAVSNFTSSSYTLTATPVAGKSQASDANCPSMTLMQVGGNTTYGDSTTMSTSICWKK